MFSFDGAKVYKIFELTKCFALNFVNNANFFQTNIT